MKVFFSDLAKTVWLLTAFTTLALQSAVSAEEPADDLISHCPDTKRHSATAQSVSEDADIILEDGRRLKLANIFLPRANANAPLPAKTIRFLRHTLSKKPIQFIPAAKADRYKRIPAHIITTHETGTQHWLQPALIKNRLGVFMPEPFKEKHNAYCDNDRLKQVLRRVDQRVMLDQNQSPPINVYQANNDALWQMEGDFALVEGVVLRTHISDKTIFLNFGADWKSDFTALIAIKNKGSLQEHFKSISNLEGKRLRLRGYLDLFNGPSMRIDHPLQMELLGE